MKKLLFTKLMLLAFMSVFILSCKDDDNEQPAPLQPKLDGFYVYGSNTIAENALEPDARMANAVLNPNKSGGANNIDGVFGKYMYIGANSTIQFSHVVDEVATVYGAENGGIVTYGGDLDSTDIADDIIHGTLQADAGPIAVTEEGLYYVYASTNDDLFRIMRVEANVIGDATPWGWDAGTPLTLKSTDVNKTVFEGTDIGLVGDAGFKYRFNEGYEIWNSNGESYDQGEYATINYLGVENYTTAWENGLESIELIYKDENIPTYERGMYTLTLTFDAATGEWSETREKTGALLTDYSTTKIGLFGNAYYKSEGVQGDWTDPYGVHTPIKDGNVYTWTWNAVELIETAEFVVLENGAWGGMAFLYNDATARAGDAFTSGAITNSGGNENFYVATGGIYDMTLTIDAETGTQTITIVPNP